MLYTPRPHQIFFAVRPGPPRCITKLCKLCCYRRGPPLTQLMPTQHFSSHCLRSALRSAQHCNCETVRPSYRATPQHSPNTPASNHCKLMPEDIVPTDVPDGLSRVEQGLTSPPADIKSVINTAHPLPFCCSLHPGTVNHRTMTDNSVQCL